MHCVVTRYPIFVASICSFIFLYLDIIEIQNGLGWKGNSGLSSSNTNAMTACSRLHSACLWLFPGLEPQWHLWTTVTVPHHPCQEQFLPHVLSKFSIFQFETITLHAVIPHLCQKSLSSCHGGPSSTGRLLESLLEPSLLQTEQSEQSEPVLIGECLHGAICRSALCLTQNSESWLFWTLQEGSDTIKLFVRPCPGPKKIWVHNYHRFWSQSSHPVLLFRMRLGVN